MRKGNEESGNLILSTPSPDLLLLFSSSKFPMLSFLSADLNTVMNSIYLACEI